jgi:hypothetical protein
MDECKKSPKSIWNGTFSVFCDPEYREIQLLYRFGKGFGVERKHQVVVRKV